MADNARISREEPRLAAIGHNEHSYHLTFVEQILERCIAIDVAAHLFHRLHDQRMRCVAEREGKSVRLRYCRYVALESVKNHYLQDLEYFKIVSTSLSILSIFTTS